VRSRFKVAALSDSATSAYLARRLAARAATVRWPPDAGSELYLGSDPDINAALQSFPKLTELLKGQ
jgi:hypothetical protein